MIRWILINFGWMVTRNKNRDAWARYLRRKYEGEK
jgi:hypothetical protein